MRPIAPLPMNMTERLARTTAVLDRCAAALESARGVLDHDHGVRGSAADSEALLLVEGALDLVARHREQLGAIARGVEAPR